MFLFEYIDRELDACELWFQKQTFRETSFARIEDELMVMLRIKGWGVVYASEFNCVYSYPDIVDFKVVADFLYVRLLSQTLEIIHKIAWWEASIDSDIIL